MHVNLKGFDTQSAPMEAIAEVTKDCLDNFISPKMAIAYINAIVCEWQA